MKRLSVLAMAVILGVVLAGAAATAEPPPELPPHPHILLIDADLEFDENANPPLIVNDFKKCVDIAANQTLRLNAHHEHFHFGTAGDALRERTGNFPLPAAPFPGVPWANCAEFEAVFAG